MNKRLEKTKIKGTKQRKMHFQLFLKCRLIVRIMLLDEGNRLDSNLTLQARHYIVFFRIKF
jgi:hypothetical protein